MDQSSWRVALSAILGVGVMAAALAAGQSLPTRSSSTSQPATDDTLPPTNFSATDVDRSALPRAAPGFVRATVAANPQAPDAHAVGEKTCIACHRLEADHFTHTLHSLGLHVANRSDPTIPVCEACHGPGSEHAAKPQGYNTNVVGLFVNVKL